MMLHIQTPNSLSVPITSLMLETAFKFADEQQTLEKRQQVFHNILSVQSVHQYMRMLGRVSQLETSDSWNPLLRQFSDVADLSLGEKGHIECRSVDMQSLNSTLPLDLPDNRIGVILVKLDCNERQAEILGFTERVAPGTEIEPGNLQSLDVFIDYLEASHQPLHVELQQWLEGIFVSGWQRAEALYGPNQYTLSYGYRSDPISLSVPVSGAKLIDLGMVLGEQSVVLLLSLSALEGGNVEILIQLYPTDEEKYLPVKLKLDLLSDSSEVLRSILSRQFDNLIQLPRIQCQRGEKFGVRIRNEEIEITEFFVI